MLQHAFRIARGNAMGCAQARALFDPKHLALNRHRRLCPRAMSTAARLKIGFTRRAEAPVPARISGS
jgi:hypothetical protein